MGRTEQDIFQKYLWYIYLKGLPIELQNESPSNPPKTNMVKLRQYSLNCQYTDTLNYTNAHMHSLSQGIIADQCPEGEDDFFYKIILMHPLLQYM